MVSVGLHRRGNREHEKDLHMKTEERFSGSLLGCDTGTIASMTGAISGAALGDSQIPDRWLQRVTETVYTPERVRQVAFDLYRKGKARNFRTA